MYTMVGSGEVVETRSILAVNQALEGKVARVEEKAMEERGVRVAKSSKNGHKGKAAGRKVVFPKRKIIIVKDRK
jgi:hypothetical protein